jgi:iron complex transport system substrate-binding protein
LRSSFSRFLLLLGSVCLVVLFSCGKGDNSNTEQRIVVLSPEVAEIIAALGASSKIVGITQECDYPPELKNIKKVGNFGAVKKESILALKPDIVFTSALEQELLTQDLRKLGLRVEQIYPRKLDELPHAVLLVGSLLGKAQEAKVVANTLALQIAKLRAQTAGRARPKVYLEIYRDPLMSVSDGSFVGEVIEAAGGDNIFPRLERDYARVSAEDVVRAKPDIIICYSLDTCENLRSRKGWQDIPAVKNNRIYLDKDIDPDLIQRASPRVIEGMRKLNKIFYPE